MCEKTLAEQAPTLTLLGLMIVFHPSSFLRPVPLTVSLPSLLKLSFSPSPPLALPPHLRLPPLPPHNSIPPFIDRKLSVTWPMQT